MPFVPVSWMRRSIIFKRKSASPPALHILRCYQHRTSPKGEGDVSKINGKGREEDGNELEGDGNENRE